MESQSRMLLEAVSEAKVVCFTSLIPVLDTQW